MYASVLTLLVELYATCRRRSGLNNIAVVSETKDKCYNAYHNVADTGTSSVIVGLAHTGVLGR